MKNHRWTVTTSLFVIFLSVLLLTIASNNSNNTAQSREEPRPNQNKTQTRRALLVGIKDYENNQNFPKLDAPENDVKAVSELLKTQKYNFNVHILPNKEATRDNILRDIKRYLIDEAESGDVCLFYFSGHGSQVKNTRGKEGDNKDETIVPYDAVRPIKNKSELKDIRDKELYALFNEAIDKGVIPTALSFASSYD